MTTSMITTANTMMTDVIVAPSLGGLMLGCMLLLTGAVPVGCVLLLTGKVPAVVNVPTVRGSVVSSEVNSVERKHTT